jgi:Vacuolar sorting protein 9 (VPS9) domain
LSLVGIGLKELLAGADEIPDQVREKTVQEQDHIRELLSGARISIREMEQEHYPLGKLQHLTAAHKSIVETLSQLFPATSSADEILPTLIYALITSRPESVNVISDLKFIQRFRASSKVDGEAAYCLVNLEAAVSFLETVDLSSLRADEQPQGPEKSSSRPSTPRVDSTPMELGITPATAPTTATNLAPSETSKPPPSPAKSQRRLSHLIAMQTNRLEAASDSLRASVLDGADQAFDTINNTLENSFRLFFGRFREHQAQSGHDVSADLLPKTLEDARKLVSTPPPHAGEDDESTVSAMEGIDEDDSVDDPLSRQGHGEKFLEIVGGRRATRDRSVDSMKSGGSTNSKRVSFLGGTRQQPTSSPPSNTSPSNASSLMGVPSATPPASGGGGAIEGMRNLGNTLNPLNQFARIGFFGRTVSGPGNGSGTATPTSHPISNSNSVVAEEDASKDPSAATESTPPSKTLSDKQSRILSAVDDLRRVKPPVKRFQECKDVKELRLGEVEELLREYQRLAAALGKVVSTS